MRGPRTRLVVLGFLIVLAGCGSDDSEDSPQYRADALPQRYGIYAVQDGEMGRIDGGRDYQVETWSKRSRLDPDVTFIVFDRALADPSLELRDAILLHRVTHLRNDVTAAGQVVPAGKSKWIVTGLPEFDVRLDFQPVAGQPDMIRVIPAQELEPGLYAMELKGGTAATAGRFGVDWPDVDQDQYASTYCVDHYAGQEVSYRSCDAPAPAIASRAAPAPAATTSRPMTSRSMTSQPLAAPTRQPAAAPRPAPAGPQGLQLREVQATQSEIGGVPTLTVQGMVYNGTTSVRAVPPLVATLRDSQGRELKRWTFVAETSQLLPGRSTGFRTDTMVEGARSADVQVGFTQAGAQQLGGTGS